jgi:dopamine beta-monooxygenase
MGAAAVAFPEEAGIPIGGPNYSRYVMLEVHYNNPQMRKGKIMISVPSE